MKSRGLAFICLREYLADDSLMDAIKAAFGGVVIANERLSREAAEDLVETGRADAAAFGKDFIATPDLVERFRREMELNPQDPATFYGAGARGYTDYPTLDQIAAE
jgi:2,4-dienoyl-CoA reductase-like NADH-dependent reductase (Old Yellow Enzyme family)